MSTAVVTFVYNELVNLPIWCGYYGALFGERNLFVIDQNSTDGSTSNLGLANKIWLARDSFDERRCVFIASLVKGLLTYFDAVIYTDCDEMLVPDLNKYKDLSDYIERRDFEYTAAVGLNLHHMLDLEGPLNLAMPILRQRRFARFTTSMCKPLITKVPLRWAPGFHAADRPIKIDQDLFLIHIKLMDYDIALKRQKLTREMTWSENAISSNHGAHQRYDDDRFTREFFLDTKNLLTNPNYGVQPFEFSQQISQILSAEEVRDGIHYSPSFNGGLVELPDHLRSAF